MQDSEKPKAVRAATARLASYFSGNIGRGLYVLVACAVLPALLIILYNGLSQRDKAVTEANERLADLAGGIANLQAEKTSQFKMLLQTLASLPEIKSLDASRCTVLFQKLKQENPELANIALLDRQGMLLAGALPRMGNPDFSDRLSFREAVRTGDFSAGDYVIGRLAKVPVMQFSYPVSGDDGELEGVLVVAHDLDKYVKLFGKVAIHKGSRLILADRNGNRMISLAREEQSPPIGQRYALTG